VPSEPCLNLLHYGSATKGRTNSRDGCKKKSYAALKEKLRGAKVKMTAFERASLTPSKLH